MKDKLVLVEWVDSNGGGGWDEPKTVLRNAEENTLGCETVGWLLAENDRYLLVASSRTTSSDKQVRDAMQIPRCAVLRVRTLTPGRARRS